MKYQNVEIHPEDLADGRVLGRDERVSISPEEAGHPHNKELIDRGSLVPVADSGEEAPKPDILEGEALKARARDLKIEKSNSKSADQLREEIAEKSAANNDEEN